MTKPIVTDARFDFRGGRNTAISPDLLKDNELVDATNVRLTATYGSITKRSGCQQIHQTAFTSDILGVTQWDGPNGKQVVAITRSGVIAGPYLWYRDGYTYATPFTSVSMGFTGDLRSSDFATFQTFRDASSGAPLYLFITVWDSIANLARYWKWDGAGTLTRLDGTTNAPESDFIMVYHTRMFNHNPHYSKTLFWGRVGDATYYTTGSKSDGGSAMVDVLSGESLVAMEVIGSSLVLASNDSVSRFTGHATDDIVIAQDTEGISAEVGAVGHFALKRFENVAAMLSERGPYAVTETEVVPIGEQVGPDFFNLDAAYLPYSVVGWNRGRKELWFAVPSATDGGLNKTVYIQGVRLQAWYGPWTYSFGIRSLTRYETIAGDESLLSAGTDKYIRDMDVGKLDDVLYDGTGGSNISMVGELPPIHFGHPGSTKTLNRMALQANVPVGSALKLQVAFDDDTFAPVDIPTTTGIDSIRIDLDGQGKRLYLQFTDASGQTPEINGFTMDAYDYGRP